MFGLLLYLERFLLLFVVNSTDMAWQVPALTFTRNLLVAMYVKSVLYVSKCVVDCVYCLGV